MKALLLILLACTFTGCIIRSGNHSSEFSTAHSSSLTGPSTTDDQLKFVYRLEGNNAILDSDKVTLIFPGLSERQRHMFFLNAGFIPLQIAGEGTAETTVSCRRGPITAILHSRYQNGINTITFCGREVILSDHARRATVAARTFDLSNGKTEINVASNNSG